MITALCEEILFRNEENGYTVASFRPIGDSGAELSGKKPGSKSFTTVAFTAVGELPFLSEGEEVVLRGEWKQHPTYGRQFAVSSFEQNMPKDRAAVIRYLASGAIVGIGPKMAEKLVVAFGDETLDVLRDSPERLTALRGVSAAKAASFSAQIREKSCVQELFLLLQQFGFGAGKVMNIFKQYGMGAAQLVRENPYRLADEVKGIGFLTADQIALSLGVDSGSPLRRQCALLYVLRQNESEGHTYMTLSQLLEKCGVLLKRLDSEVESAKNGVVAAARSGASAPNAKAAMLEGFFSLMASGNISCYVIDEEHQISLLQEREDFDGQDFDKIRVAYYSVLDKEIRCAKSLSEKVKDKGAEPFLNDCLLEIERAATELRIQLASEQQQAVLTAAMEPVSIVTGGPGTGKTTIIRVIARYFSEKGKKLVLCAPTGRAAKRMTEASGISAGTIHRLLEVEKSGSDELVMSFQRNAEHPIDGDVIIVDEVSMLDTALFYHFLQAVAKGTRLIFVGDQDQLPSVGAGNVLSDMILSEILPVTRLTQIFRQSEESSIVLNAHRVLKGADIVFDQSLDSDCMLIARASGEDVMEAVVKLCAKVLPETYGVDVIRDSIVLSPARRGPGGVTELNRRLQEVLEDGSSSSMKYKNFVFSVGSKVIQIRNNYDLSYRMPGGSVGMGVFNGEIGLVKTIAKESITVEMEDGRKVLYNEESFDDLEMAYALTVHKSQGSEYPIVILAIPSGPPLLNHRNLLYTALTRAKKRVFIVSSKEILRRMIQNRSQQKRQTSLASFLIIYGTKA